jgi:hypothetical protein
MVIKKVGNPLFKYAKTRTVYTSKEEKSFKYNNKGIPKKSGGLFKYEYCKVRSYKITNSWVTDCKLTFIKTPKNIPLKGKIQISKTGKIDENKYLQ